MSKTSKTIPSSGVKPRIVFFGNERIATGVMTTNPILRMLIDDGYDVAAIILHHTVNGASRRQRELEILSVAAAHGIPVLYPAKLADIAKTLTTYDAVAGVLVAYGKLIPEQIIRLFPHGIINIHPSALPKHRGSSPLESVILDGSLETAVSVMALAPEMDAGPIYAQAPVVLTGQETKQSLADELLETSAATLHVILPKILTGECVALPQDESAATYDSLITKQDGKIDPTKPAVRLEREVRAYAGWPGSRMNIAGKDVTIIDACISDNRVQNVDKKTIFVADKQLHLQTSDGILTINSLRPAGKGDMSAGAFLAGYGRQL